MVDAASNAARGGSPGPHAPCPVPTVDIVQEMLDKHGYPAWSVRSESHWPVYRSAQLRFLPALDWMRQRVMADPNKNPKTNAFFGSAQWVLLVDDDSFVFYHNLKTHLELMDHSKKIYTGLVSPSYWIPTNLSLTEPRTPRTDPSAFRAQCTTCTKCTVHQVHSAPCAQCTADAPRAACTTRHAAALRACQRWGPLNTVTSANELQYYERPSDGAVIAYRRAGCAG